MTVTGPEYPQTAEEWQAAVNVAAGDLAYRAACEAKLTRGSAEAVDVVYCDFILDEGRKLGVLPDGNVVRKLVLDRMTQ